ncbi:MAG: TlpA disulfide reductase family protein [bacterium]|nr:TlpA disulfide reductase family protein [bacterium]
MKLFGWLGAALLILGAACTGRASLDSSTQATSAPAYLAPDFTLPSLDGEAVTLSDLRGRWVLVNFWATWCIPCVEEMPALQQLARNYTDTLRVLAINQRESRAEIETFLAQHQLDLTILINPDDATLGAYQVMGLPQTVLITPQGEIDYRHFGPLEFDDFNTYFTERLRENE